MLIGDAVKPIILKIMMLFIAMIFALSCICAMAHPGGLDKNGGHYNRKTGEYHYHKNINTDTALAETIPAKTEKQKVEVDFEQSESDGLISKLLMYLYICALFSFVLQGLYKSAVGRYLKFIFAAMAVFLLICAYSMAENSARAGLWMTCIWFGLCVFISYGIYSAEKQARQLKKLGLKK